MNNIILRYGEISLKGNNKNYFIKILKNNVTEALKDYAVAVEAFYDYIQIEMVDSNQWPNIKEALQLIFGFVSFSLATKTKQDLTNITQAAIDIMALANKFETFCLDISRSDKSFIHNSLYLKQHIGTHLCQTFNKKVLLKNSDLKMMIEIKKEAVFLSLEKITGLGGLPVGSSGRVLLLISGGIDSAVSSFLLMKKGLIIDYLHFETPPYTTPEATLKVIDIIKTLNKYTPWPSRLFVCNFSPLQNEINHITDLSYKIIIAKRMFFKIAQQICQKYQLKVIATGESVGQVASQTIESLQVIDHAIDNLILRPLICFDKQEIINLAKKIDTYKTSILPFTDCCTLFIPHRVVTKPNITKVIDLESNIMSEALIELSLQKTYLTMSSIAKDT